MDAPKRKFGFPLLMLAGFCIGAGLAVATAFIIASEVGRFSYTGLFDLVAALGGLGAYAGHVVGAARNKDAGFKPFGPLTPGALGVGGAIVVVGTAVVLAAVLGIMVLLKGPPPH
jgi:hypothetical protein